MAKRHRARSARLGRWLPYTVFPFGLLACATVEATHHATLVADYRRSASPGPEVSVSETTAVDIRKELDRAAFIRAILARNPTIEAARQGWRAAIAEYPQVSALDDPMIEYALAPLSIGSSDVPFGQVIGVSQRIPWPGKLALAGRAALSEAEAEKQSYESVRRHLAKMGSILFDHYYAATRTLALNEEHRLLAEDIRSAAEAQYEAGHASQQDALQAEVELAHVIHQRVVLESRRAVITAQMNGLLHRNPETALPPPPKRIRTTRTATQAEEALQAEAINQRPEIKREALRVQGRASAKELAERNFYPDFGVMTSYNSMWRQTAHQWMLGFTFNIPIQLGSRRAADEEAEARLRQAHAKEESTIDQVRVEVEQARQRLAEAKHVLRLYDGRLLPAVRAQIDAARIGYETGRGGFQALIDAERSLRTLEIQHVEAIAAFGQRQAELEWALGRIPGLPEGEWP